MVGKGSTPGTTPTDGSIKAQAYDLSRDHLLGNPNALVKVIEYADLECPYCKTFHTTMHQVMDYYGEGGQVAWVYRAFPLTSIHSKAPKEAEASECAAAQGGDAAFFAYLDKIYEITPSENNLDLAQLPVVAKQLGLNVDAFNKCLNEGTYSAKVTASYNEAIAAGGQGTPYVLVMANDALVPGGNLSGSQPYDSMRAIIDAVLQGLPASN